MFRYPLAALRLSRKGTKPQTNAFDKSDRILCVLRGTWLRPIGCIAILAGLSGVALRPDALHGGELKKPVECLVCGELHTTGDFTADYKGRRIPLCSQACLAEFQQLERAGALDKATGKIEPRAALFQADSNPKPQLSQAYFLTGLYLLLGLACGGLASYLAVQKGQSGWPAFALGLGLNVLGLALVWLKPKRAMMFTSKGLSKIPSTRDELLCGSCGHPNHPSARACNVCRAPLNPVAPSEVSLAGLHKESRE